MSQRVPSRSRDARSADRCRLACLVLLGSGCQDVCDEVHEPLGINDPGPFGEAPIERVGFTEGTRVGTLTWAGDFDVEVVTTLASTAEVIDREHVGPGRLACIDSIEVVATVSIETPNKSLLDEEFEVVLAVSDTDPMTSIESHLDISDHDFKYLGFIPASAPKDLGLALRLVWMGDAAGTMQGWITLGGDTVIHFEVAVDS